MVSPNRIARSTEPTDTLRIKFAENSIPAELDKSGDMDVKAWLAQGKKTVSLQYAGFNGQELLERVPENITELIGGSADLVVEFHNAVGLRRATVQGAVTLYAPVHFMETATFYVFPTYLKPIESIVIARDPKAAATYPPQLAVSASFPLTQSEADRDRVCYFSLEDLNKLDEIAPDPAKWPVGPSLCPIKEFTDCKLSVVHYGCVVGLCEGLKSGRNVALISPSSCMALSDPAKTSYAENSIVAGDPLSEIIAVASPSIADSPLSILSAQDLSRMPLRFPGNLPLEKLAVGDIDGDGAADVISIDQALLPTVWRKVLASFSIDNSLSSAINITMPQSRSPVGFALADIDQDGMLDIVLMSTRVFTKTSLAVHVLYGQGHGYFTIPQLLPLPKTINDIYADAQLAVGDLDGDGSPDLVFTLPSSQIAIVFNKAK